MKSMKNSYVIIMLLLALGIMSILLNTDGASAETKAPYTKDDCVKCHATQVKDIATAGRKHRSVPCTGCHVGHPPEVQKPIAPCNKCHVKTRKAHFEIGGCLNCHTNPHTPLNITFRGKADCLYCHAFQSEQLMAGKSKHSALDCAVCHDVHRKLPQCTQCHNLHSPELAASDCKKCHKPHAPTQVAYADDIPSKDCGMCHSDVLKTLASSNAKHKTFTCAFCHKEKHKMVPTCQSCHGSPHSAGIMRKFSKCSSCHNLAHALNWFATEAQIAPEHVQQKETRDLPAR
jgi:hypothetical protein